MYQRIKADHLFLGNAIFTGCCRQTVSGGVAVKGNKIIAVASQEKIFEWADKKTNVIDCKDRLIMPGFHDSHFHVAHGVLRENGVDLSGAKSEEEAAVMVAEFAREHPEEPIIFGFYWYHMNWDRKELPAKTSLDRLIPDRPVVLYRVESHGAWLNSKALEMCRITKDTIPPEGGDIVKNSAGEPSGYLHEYAIFLMGPNYGFTPEQEKKKFIGFFDKLASFGITSISDLEYDVPTNFDLFLDWEKSGDLKLRYGFATLMDGGLEKPRRYRERYNSDKVKYLGLKCYTDGTALGYTAELLQPYSDKPETRNDAPLDYNKILSNALAADGEGFRIRFHAIGDGAVRFSLDTFEECRRINGARDSRHSIAHIEVIHPDDIRRFAELGVIAEIHPAHVNLPCEKAADNPYPLHLGERTKYCFPYKSILEHGGRIAIGSDYPVVDPNPMLGIYRAVTRRFDDGLPESGWLPQQRLTMGEVLQGYTAGTAYHDFKENKTGTLEVGKLADIVVLDRNLFEIDPEEVKQTEVLLTMFDGNIIYQR